MGKESTLTKAIFIRCFSHKIIPFLPTNSASKSPQNSFPPIMEVENDPVRETSLTKTRMKNGPFEDAFPLESEDIPASYVFYPDG